MKYRSLKGYKYELLKSETIPLPRFSLYTITDDEFVYLAKGKLTVRAHYAWDGPSGPTIDTENFMLGSLVHDSLYQMIRKGKLPYECKDAADRALQDICIKEGMSKFRAWYVYWGVRLFGFMSLK